MQRRVEAFTPWAAVITMCAAVVAVFVGPVQTDPAARKFEHAAVPAITHAISAQPVAWFLVVSAVLGLASLVRALFFAVPRQYAAIGALTRFGAVLIAGAIAVVIVYMHPRSHENYGPLPFWLFIHDPRAFMAEMIGFITWMVIFGSWMETLRGDHY